MEQKSIAKCFFTLLLTVLTGVPFQAAHAVLVDVTSGTTGSILFNQSFNGETRAVDLTVLGPSNLGVFSLTLDEFNIVNPAGGTVGARIYSSSGTLLASANAAVNSGFDQSVTLPISATLLSAGTFRVGFFVSSGTGGNSGDVFDPNPGGVGGFPYIESNGLLSVDGAFSIASDSFPTNSNIFVPLMKLNAHSVPEPTTLLLLGLGLAGLGFARKRLH